MGIGGGGVPAKSAGIVGFSLLETPRPCGLWVEDAGQRLGGRASAPPRQALGQRKGAACTEARG